MEPDKKREFDRSLEELGDVKVKKVLYDINSYQEMGLFNSPITPLLVPEFNLQSLRTPSLI